VSVRAVEVMAWHPEIPGWNLPGPGEESWQDSALCVQTDPEAFFPEKGGSVRQPKAICRRCPVVAECLDYALEHGERFGIWGGLTERERRLLLAARAAKGLAA
jgi:WhiB family transcriptional regulator, redox-sensing transcriptional regulator